MGGRRFVWVVALSLLIGGLTVSGTSIAHSDNCGDAGGDAGFGGVQLSCTFACNKDAELFVEIESSDEDAAVEARADCGGADAECSGMQTCSGASRTELTTFHSDSGTCTGETEEAWDSPASLACDASPTGTDSPCLIECQQIQSSDQPSMGSTVTMYMVYPVAWGSVCNHHGCTSVVPTCVLEDSRWICSVD